jgi:hypothetical protein
MKTPGAVLRHLEIFLISFAFFLAISRAFFGMAIKIDGGIA